MILKDINLQIDKKEKCGIIGRNGQGKTTLFKIILGETSVDNGEVQVVKKLKIGYLEQLNSYLTDLTVETVLEDSFHYLLEINDELESLGRKLEKDSTPKLLERYGQLQSEFENGEGYQIREKIINVCEGLKIPKKMIDQPYNSLSGGEKTRVQMAKILLEKPDLLLLDEPTNHLDLDSVEWLEQFLKGYTGAYLIISHDRYFLDRVVTKIVEVEDCSILVQRGNYSSFIREKERSFANKQKEYHRQQKQISELKESIRKNRIRAKKQPRPAVFQQIKVLISKLERIVLIKEPKAPYQMRFNLNTERKSSKTLLRMENLNFGYGERSIFSDLNLDLARGDRVAIIGENGSGKSTFLKLMLGDLKPDSGSIYVGEGINIGYLDQSLGFEVENISIYDYFRNKLNLTSFQAHSILAQFLFREAEMGKSIESLSGGERTRLKLAIICSKKINTLILDEPTNHLDIYAREIIENAVSAFKGNLIFISHDRYFINKLANRVITISSKGFMDFKGSYQSYRLSAQSVAGSNNSKVVIRNKNYEEVKKNRRVYEKQQVEIGKLEDKIGHLEEKIILLDKVIHQSKSNFEKVNNLFYKKKELEQQRDNLLDKWCLLQEAG
jgi:ATPase subunit of ABC transporter with duplicated ATPase domains/rRNA processing protein Gar1